ncbi:MAG TPA: methionine adenosyltransferase, partial [Candidatus Peribacter riflensis]|nr:methionine adenosyltransferase [Candidatus Peribacter riflensis]
GKSQVTVQYGDDGKPQRLQCVVISTQHAESALHEQIEADITKHVIEPVCGKYLDKDSILHINPTGRFVVGGPPGDCGLTGRKIIV